MEAAKEEVLVQSGEVSLEGTLAIPQDAQSIVVFAHGSGSSRFSERNRHVADALNQAGLATLLFDLLTAEEHQVDQITRELRFDIGLLATRLTGAVDWLEQQSQTSQYRIGLFGASTGAAAALITAAERPDRIATVVSRGGRPDLAGQALGQVQASVLLIVGGQDFAVIDMNRQAARSLQTQHHIEIVPGATHLFEEPGKLEQVAKLAQDWFKSHLVQTSREAQPVESP